MLLRRWFRASPFRPDYADAGLMRALHDASAAHRPVDVNNALAAWRSARADDAAALIVGHFDRRQTPRFFIDSPASRLAVNVSGANVSDASDHAAPPWRRRASADDDVLFAVHPHRFGFAPDLAREAAGQQAHALRFKLLLEDWTDFAAAQPHLPFISNLVAIQRLVACMWAYAFLVQADTKAAFACRHMLLKIIVQDIAYLRPRLGDSYPNNHLLLDRFGAWLITLLYPEFVPSSTDLEALDRAWVAELFRQTYVDGGSFEHSIHYHGFAAEMAAGYVLLSERNGRHVADVTRARVEKMLRMQACLCGTDGHAADIGDRSDDPLFPLAGVATGNAAPMREIYRALFAPQMPPLRRGHPGLDRAYLLLDGRTAPATERGEEPRLVEFAHSGIALFVDDPSTRCVFRTGPTERSQVLAGHMHADLMSVTLVSRGVPILVDPGTYTYRFRPNRSAVDVNWRDYFAGAGAHNGLVVGSKNPLGALAGDFRDAAVIPVVRHVASGRGDGISFLEAGMEPIDDYPGLRRGVVHLEGVGFIVYNRLQRPGVYDDLRFAFQLAPECATIVAADRSMTARRPEAEIGLIWSAGIGPVEVVSGRESPTNGWVSRRYGERSPAPQLLFDTARDESLTAFVFLLHGITGDITIECTESVENSRCFRIRSRECCDYVLLNVASVESPVKAWGISFRGRLAWIRMPAHGAPTLRWIDGLSCEAPELGLHYRHDTVQNELSR